jgi:hypothetical protein
MIFAVYLSEKPSLELCKSLIMLRDYNISGRINIVDIPVLMHMLQFWRVSLFHFFLLLLPNQYRLDRSYSRPNSLRKMSLMEEPGIEHMTS